MGAKFSLQPAFDIPKAAKNLASIELFTPAGALAEKFNVLTFQEVQLRRSERVRIRLFMAWISAPPMAQAAGSEYYARDL